MIVVDTSVFIAARRNPAGPDFDALQALIESDEAALALPVRIELLAGVAQNERAAMRRALAAMPLAFPTEETWRLIESWIEPAAKKGHWFGLADWLIAALASERGALVWSLDADFAQMEKLKLIQLYR